MDVHAPSEDSPLLQNINVSNSSSLDEEENQLPEIEEANEDLSGEWRGQISNDDETIWEVTDIENSSSTEEATLQGESVHSEASPPLRSLTPKSVHSETSMDSGCDCDHSEGESPAGASHSRRNSCSNLRFSPIPGTSKYCSSPKDSQSSTFLDCDCDNLDQRCNCSQSKNPKSLNKESKAEPSGTNRCLGEPQNVLVFPKVTFSIGSYEDQEDCDAHPGCSSSNFCGNALESASQSGSEPGDEFKELVRSASKPFPRVTSYSKSGMLSASSSTASMPMCRICHFPQGEGLDLLISPCRCSGTMQYIHESCLSKWLEVSSKRKKPATCELCYYQFNRHKKFKLRHWQLPSCSKLDKLLHSVFICCLLAMTTCATITIYCFKQDRFVKKREDTELTNSEIVTLTCGVLFFVAFFAAMYVEVKAKDTLYKLFSKFIDLNQTWHIDEYDKRRDKQNFPV